MSDQRFVKGIAESQRAAFLGYGSGATGLAFTPSWGGSTSDGVIGGYDVRFGAAYRIGEVVFWVAGVSASSITTFPTGNLRIIGLPITAGTASSFYPATIGYTNDADFSTANVLSGTTGCEFYDASGVVVPASFLTVTQYIIVSGFYFV